MVKRRAATKRTLFAQPPSRKTTRDIKHIFFVERSTCDVLHRSSTCYVQCFGVGWKGEGGVEREGMAWQEPARRSYRKSSPYKVHQDWRSMKRLLTEQASDLIFCGSSQS